MFHRHLCPITMWKRRVSESSSEQYLYFEASSADELCLDLYGYCPKYPQCPPRLQTVMSKTGREDVHFSDSTEKRMKKYSSSKKSHQWMRVQKSRDRRRWIRENALTYRRQNWMDRENGRLVKNVNRNCSNCHIITDFSINPKSTLHIPWIPLTFCDYRLSPAYIIILIGLLDGKLGATS